jgi:hypothetical protein
MPSFQQAVAHVFDMSYPDHGAFVDSAGDCLDALLARQKPWRAALSEFMNGQAGCLLPQMTRVTRNAQRASPMLALDRHG